MDMKDSPLKMLGVLCDHSAAKAAAAAGVEGLLYSPEIKLMRVVCAADVDHMFVLNALWRGVDGVFIAGCAPGGGYFRGCNYTAERRLETLRDVLDAAGIPRERVRGLWIAATDGKAFAAFVNGFYDDIRKMKPWSPLKA
ncbi:MAG: hydrogenase iron-sulfur subunit, partial [bacterium]